MLRFYLCHDMETSVPITGPGWRQYTGHQWIGDKTLWFSIFSCPEKATSHCAADFRRHGAHEKYL